MTYTLLGAYQHHLGLAKVNRKDITFIKNSALLKCRKLAKREGGGGRGGEYDFEKKPLDFN